MPVTHKDPDVRRKELVDAAERLFNENGYENTSVNAIIRRVGIAKGTFYHYFRSKEQIYHAVLDSFWEDFWGKAGNILSSDATADAKLREFMIASINFATRRKYMAPVFQRPENILIADGLIRDGISKLSPVISSIIHQGIREGIFQVDFPDETAEYLLLNGIISFVEPYDDSDRKKRLDFFCCYSQKLLGSSSVIIKKMTDGVFS